MVDKSPFDGHPDFLQVSIGTRDERSHVIDDMLIHAARYHDDPGEALRHVVLETLTQVIAECAATSMGAGDPDAANVGWALAASIMHGSSLNLRLVQLLGDAADRCAEHDERAGVA